MAKAKNDDPEIEPQPTEDAHEKRLPPHASKETVTPLEGETTRVMLTGDNRHVLTERYVPTVEFGFRIYVDGQHYEHVGEGEGGVWIFAPTR